MRPAPIPCRRRSRLGRCPTCPGRLRKTADTHQRQLFMRHAHAKKLPCNAACSNYIRKLIDPHAHLCHSGPSRATSYPLAASCPGSSSIVARLILAVAVAVRPPARISAGGSGGGEDVQAASRIRAAVVPCIFPEAHANQKTSTQEIQIKKRYIPRGNSDPNRGYPSIYPLCAKNTHGRMKRGPTGERRPPSLFRWTSRRLPLRPLTCPCAYEPRPLL